MKSKMFSHIFICLIILCFSQLNAQRQGFIDTEKKQIMVPITLSTSDQGEKYVDFILDYENIVNSNDVFAIVNSFCDKHEIGNEGKTIINNTIHEYYEISKSFLNITFANPSYDPSNLASEQNPKFFSFKFYRNKDNFDVSMAQFCTTFLLNTEGCLYYKKMFAVKFYEKFKVYPHEDLVDSNANKNALQALFSKVYEFCLWEVFDQEPLLNHDENGVLMKTAPGRCSGLGSRIENTKNVRQYIYSLIQKYHINSFLDAPCGGMAWQPLLLYEVMKINSKFRYTGVDIVPSVVSRISQEFASIPSWDFYTVDITKQTLEGQSYDLVMTRDVFFHLTFDLIKCAINNIKLTNSTYLLSTNHKFIKVVKNDTATGTIIFDKVIKQADLFSGHQYMHLSAFREVDLTLPPFNFPDPIESFTNNTHGDIFHPLGENNQEKQTSKTNLIGESGIQAKYTMALWKLSDLPIFTKTETDSELICY